MYVYTHVSNTYDTCAHSGMFLSVCVVCRYREGRSEKKEHAREGKQRQTERERKTGVGGGEREREKRQRDRQRGEGEVSEAEEKREK